MAHNPTLTLLHTRRSVKAADMQEPGPNADELKAILQAGLRVPDHGKIRPWRIQVLHKNGQKKLGKKLAGIFAQDHPDASEKQLAFELERPCRAPLLLIVASTPDSDKYFKAPYMEQLLSAGAVCQNILIAANALGFVTQWITEWPAYHKQVKKLLGYNESVELVGFIYIGTNKAPQDDRERPTFEDVVSEWE